MTILKINNRFKITIILATLAIVLSIGAGFGYAFFFGSTNVNLNKGLVGYWDFGVGSTTTKTPDRTPYNHDGTVASATLTTDRKGRSNKAYSFPGTAAKVQFTDPGIDNTSTFTISLWVKPDSSFLSDFRDILSYGTGNMLISNTSGTQDDFYVLSSGTETTTIQCTDCWTVNSWNHTVFKSDGSNWVLYVNNVSKANGVVDAVLNGSGTITLGSRDGETAPWKGILDDVRIYNRALSATEVTALYNSYDPGVVVSSLEQGLVGYWDFGAGSSSTKTPDRTPYNHDGTFSGNAAVTASDRKSQANKALTLDGTGDFISLSTSTHPYNSTATYSAWVYADDTATEGGIWGHDLNDVFSMVYQACGGLVLNEGAIWGQVHSNAVEQHVSTSITATTWTHFVFVKNMEAQTITLYKNGVSAGSTDFTAATLGIVGGVNRCDGNRLTIGRYDTQNVVFLTSPYFKGDMDDVRLYNRALSSAEVIALYNSYDPGAVVSTLQKGLMGHWDFGAGSTTLATPDRTPYNNDGVVSTATLTTDRKSQSSSAYLFNGTTDYIQVTDASAIQNIFDSGGTVSAWINVTSSGENTAGRIIDKGAVNLFWVDANGALSSLAAFSGGGSYIWRTASATISYGSWTHVVMTYNNSSTANDPVFYKNGVAVSNTTDATPVGTRTTDVGSDLFIGNNSANDRTFDGKLDDMRVYKRALSATEVLDLYNSYR